jgi:hypothetical protein
MTSIRPASDSDRRGSGAIAGGALTRRRHEEMIEAGLEHSLVLVLSMAAL